MSTFSPETKISYSGAQPQWREVSHIESIGSAGHIGIAIYALGIPVELTNDEISPIREKAEELRELVAAANFRRDPSREIEAREERNILLGLFPAPIYVEDLPNGYCNKACCSHRPWFRVTTTAGPIVIGWRKRVISIDWSESAVTQKAEALFPNENVTKGDRFIHAWSYGKAQAYIEAIVAAAPV